MVPNRQIHVHVPQPCRRLTPRPGIPEHSEHLEDGRLYALVWILADAVALAHKTCRNTPVERPAQRLVASPALNAGPQDR